jgi:HEAT repeat protein
METFAAIVLLLSGTSCFLLVVLAGRRVHLSLRNRKRREIEAEWRPRVVAFVEDGETLPEVASGKKHAIVVDLLATYARMVRGDGRRRVIAHLGADGTIASEVAALQGRKPWRRAAAAHRLGDIGDEQAVGPLVKALDDEDRDVRTAAARSLGRLQRPEAVEPLLAAVVQRAVPEALVRWALLEIGKPALPHLRRLMEHPEPAQRSAAVQLGGLLGEERDSFEPARASARALARIAPDLVKSIASSRGGHLREAADLASLS